MDLRSLLSREGRKARAVARASAKAGNAKIKPEDRQPALETLLFNGSEEAVRGLLRRFTFNYDSNSVADEQEKSYIYEGLVTLGPSILPALRHHLRNSPTLSWGLRLLGEVFDRDQTWSVVEEVIQDYEPGYERDPSRKLQLVKFLADLDDPRVPATIIGYLDDHDETVRYVTVDALFRHGDEAVARERLLQLLTNEQEDSLRLKNRILDGFVANDWDVKGFRGTVEKMIPEDFLVDGKGRIRRKKGKSTT